MNIAKRSQKGRGGGGMCVWGGGLPRTSIPWWRFVCPSKSVIKAEWKQHPSPVGSPSCLLRLPCSPGAVPGAQAGSSGHLSTSTTRKGTWLTDHLDTINTSGPPPSASVARLPPLACTCCSFTSPLRANGLKRRPGRTLSFVPLVLVFSSQCKARAKLQRHLDP